MWLKKLCLLFTALLFGLLLCEVMARMVYPAPPNPWRDPQILYVADAELGFIHVPNQEGWVEDGRVTINSLGLRGREVVSPKPRDRFRVLVLGDSITMGVGVHDDETYCAQLELLLRQQSPDRDLEVVNCGVNMYSTWQEAALLKRFAPQLQPDLVLVGFYFNDLWGWRVGSADGAGAPKFEPGRILHMSTKEGTLLERELRRSRAIYCLGHGVRGLLAEGGDQDGGRLLTQKAILEGDATPELARAWSDVENPLLKIHALARSEGCPVGLVVLPCREQVTRDCPQAQYQTKVKEMGERLGYFVVDPLPRFVDRRSSVDSLFIPYDGHHPAGHGHRVIAETLADYLRERPELLQQRPRN